MSTGECRMVRGLLSTYVDRELSLPEDQAVQVHLLTCTSCCETLRAFQTLDTQFRSEPAALVPPNLADLVLGNIDPHPSDVPSGQMLLHIAGISAVLLGLAAVALVGLVGWKESAARVSLLAPTTRELGLQGWNWVSAPARWPSHLISTVRSASDELAGTVRWVLALAGEHRFGVLAAATSAAGTFWILVRLWRREVYAFLEE